jgi:hypothetical protein
MDHCGHKSITFEENSIFAISLTGDWDVFKQRSRFKSGQHPWTREESLELFQKAIQNARNIAWNLTFLRKIDGRTLHVAVRATDINLNELFAFLPSYSMQIWELSDKAKSIAGKMQFLRILSLKRDCPSHQNFWRNCQDERVALATGAELQIAISAEKMLCSKWI